MLAFAFETMAMMGVTILIMVIGMLILLIKCYKKPSQGQVIIRDGFEGTKVSFNGMIVIPIIHSDEWLDITLKRIVIDRQNNEALTCKDGVEVNIKAAFFVRIKPIHQGVLKVIQALGTEGASDIETLYNLFSDRFITAISKVTQDHSYEELNDREYFKKQVISVVGDDLNGYILDTVIIDYFEKSKTA